MSSNPKRKTFLQEFYPEADDVQQQLRSISNSLDEIAKMEKDINSTTTPNWIQEKLKDEAEEQLANLRQSANHAINAICELTNQNRRLHVDTLEHRTRKVQIDKLTDQIILISKRIEKLGSDFRTRSLSVSAGSQNGTGSQSLKSSRQSTLGADNLRIMRMSKSIDELKGQFAQVSAEISRSAESVEYSAKNGGIVELGHTDFGGGPERMVAETADRSDLSTSAKIVILLLISFIMILTYSFYFI